jgi:hypothetical protein
MIADWLVEGNPLLYSNGGELPLKDPEEVAPLVLGRPTGPHEGDPRAHRAHGQGQRALGLCAHPG